MCNVRTVGIACFICSVIIFALIAGTHVRLALDTFPAEGNVFLRATLNVLSPFRFGRST